MLLHQFKVPAFLFPAGLDRKGRVVCFSEGDEGEGAPPGVVARAGLVGDDVISSFSSAAPFSEEDSGGNPALLGFDTCCPAPTPRFQ